MSLWWQAMLEVHNKMTVLPVTRCCGAIKTWAWISQKRRSTSTHGFLHWRKIITSLEKQKSKQIVDKCHNCNWAEGILSSSPPLKEYVTMEQSKRGGEVWGRGHLLIHIWRGWLLIKLIRFWSLKYSSAKWVDTETKFM